jgi:hypothetical protein
MMVKSKVVYLQDIVIEKSKKTAYKIEITTCLDDLRQCKYLSPR